MRYPDRGLFLPMRYLLAVVKYGLLLIALAGVAALAGYITIKIVTGKESVVVPDLAGLEMSEAYRRLEAVGLRPQLAEQDQNAFDERVPANHVIRQSPAAGSILKRDRKVKVTLSLGARDVYVPRVVGERLNSAQVRIFDAGLRVGDVVYVSTSLVPDNVVIDQEPPRLTTGDDRVNLLVSGGDEPTAFVMPDLIYKPAREAGRMLERAGFRVRIEVESYDGFPAGTIVRQKPLAGYQIRVGDTIGLWSSRPSF